MSQDIVDLSLLSVKAESSVKCEEVALWVHNHLVTFSSWWRCRNSIFPGRQAVKASRDIHTWLLRKAESRHGQTQPPPSYLWMKYLGCSLPSEPVLWGACKDTAVLYLPQMPQQGCTVSAANGAASWHGCPQREPSFQGCLFLIWPVLVSCGRAWTLQNSVWLAPSPKPAQAQGAAPSAAGNPMETPSLEEPEPRFFLIWAIIFTHPS